MGRPISSYALPEDRETDTEFGTICVERRLHLVRLRLIEVDDHNGHFVVRRGFSPHVAVGELQTAIRTVPEPSGR